MSQTNSAASSQSNAKAMARAVFWPLFLIILVVFAYRVISTAQPSITPRVSFVTADATPYWEGVIVGAKAAADQYGVDLDVVKPSGDLESQESILASFDPAARDGIAISPVDAVRQTTRLRQIAGNASLVTVDSDSELSNRICFVGMDNADAGRKTAQLIRTMLPNGGSVLILAGPLEKANGRERREGLLGGLLGWDIDAAPQDIDADSVQTSESYSVGPTLLDEIDPDAATNQLVEYLNNNSERPDCIVGLYGYHAGSIVAALNQVENTDSIRVIGFDALPETLEAMSSGSVHGVIAQDQFSYGFESIRILAEAIRGAEYALPLNRRVEYPPVVVTPENLESFLRDAGRTSPAG